MATCSTCAQPLPPDNLSEAKQRPARQTPCCDRTICGACQAKNPRFQVYCPFCQISSAPSTLPQGLRDPPGYEEAEAQETERKRLEEMRRQRDVDLDDRGAEEPPAYTEGSNAPARSSRGQDESSQREDVLHYIRPDDTMTSVSLAYNVPLGILRSHNNLYSDHLLSARHAISIPASHYQGPSLSAEPVESEEERERKARLRRFMMRTKCTDYAMAEVYLRDAKEDVGNAVQRWEDDERWERENPMKGGSTAPARKRGFAGGLTGQIE